MLGTTRIRRGLVAAGVAVAAVSAGAGCGVVATAAREAVEQQIRSRTGADTATCPGDLEGTVGTSFTCTAAGPGGTFFVVATVTSVDGDEVGVDIDRVGTDGAAAPPAGRSAEDFEIDGATGEVDGPKVAAAVSEQLTATAGRSPDRVTCPDLPAVVGSSIRCELVAGPDTLGLTVTVSSVRNGRVAFDVQVDAAPS